MTTEIIKAVEDVKKTLHDFQEIQKEFVDEKKMKGYVDTLTESKFDKVNEALSKAEEKADSALKAAELAQMLAKRRDEVEYQKAQDDSKQKVLKSALIKYLRGGNDNLITEEKEMLISHTKALSTFEGPDGGYAVSSEFDKRIIEIIRETSPIRQLAEVVTIGSDKLEEPYEGDDFEAGWVGEEETRNETTTGKLNMLEWNIHEPYAMPAISQKLLDDAYFDIEGYVTRKVADRIARYENTAFVSGDGVKKPRGFLTYDAGTGFNQIEQINSGTAGEITYNGLVDLVFSLKDGYMPGAVFMMKRATVKEIRKILDGSGNPIWTPGLGGTPSTIMEFPVIRADDMPAVASAALSVAFGNFKEGYRIVDRMGTRILRDPYTKKGYVRLYTTKRVGGGVKNFEAIKLLKLSA